MRRVVIVVFVLIGIIAVSAFARHRMSDARERLSAYAQVIFAYIEKEDNPAIQDAVAALTKYWQREQMLLILFVRHSEIDDLSRSVARLQSYAAFEEHADLHAELKTILWQIDHLLKSEKLRVGTVLL